MTSVFIILLCYLIGSIPFSYLFTRLFTKQDIRKKGSGNVGATNVLRTSGKSIALLALTGDLLKGVIAAWIGKHAGGQALLIICPVAAVIGHCYPVFLKFRGGKGVATAAGVILVLMPSVCLILLLSFIAICAVSRYVSLGSVLAAALFPVMTIVITKSWPYFTMSLIIALVVIYRHRGNIDRLRKGIEPKINDPA
ncbi:MAG: glycerol-3-phosphate 1-O-acyltransferase PlsY [Syntrophomonas sp.]